MSSPFKTYGVVLNVFQSYAQLNDIYTHQGSNTWLFQEKGHI
jgi:type IV secretory pathway TraG/TraD family ATPase VirD4